MGWGDSTYNRPPFVRLPFRLVGGQLGCSFCRTVRPQPNLCVNSSLSFCQGIPDGEITGIHTQSLIKTSSIPMLSGFFVYHSRFGFSGIRSWLYIPRWKRLWDKSEPPLNQVSTQKRKCSLKKIKQNRKREWIKFLHKSANVRSIKIEKNTNSRLRRLQPTPVTNCPF